MAAHRLQELARAGQAVALLHLDLELPRALRLLLRRRHPPRALVPRDADALDGGAPAQLRARGLDADDVLRCADIRTAA